MKRPNITPGPWQDFNMTGAKGYRVTIDSEGRQIAAISLRLPDAVDANAQAIAAVPDLLEALQLLTYGCEQAVKNGLNQPQVNGGLVLARAALTKAGYTF